MDRTDQIRLALLGNSGVGKDTFAVIAKDYYDNQSFSRIRLAEPLYQIQYYI